MMPIHYPRTSVPGTGVISYCHSDLLGGMTLLSGEAFTGAYRPHVHSTFAIGVVERGTLALSIRGHTHMLARGSVLLINPNEVHAEYAVPPSGWSFRHFFLSQAALRLVLGRPREDLWFPVPVLHHPWLADRLGRLHELLFHDAGAVGRHAESELVQLLQMLAARGAGGRDREGHRTTVERVLDHIHGRLPDPTRLEALAKVAGLSPFHLVRVFRQQVGLPPYAYYEQLRIAGCKELLHEGRALSEIACIMRYSDQSHFTRQFAATAGVSPGKYAVMVGSPRQRFAIPAPRPRILSGDAGTAISS